MLEYVDPGSGLDFWTADDIREDSPEDAPNIDDDQIGVHLHSGDGDGALVIGTHDQLRAYFHHIANALRANPRS